MSYPVQDNIYMPTCIDNRSVATQLDDFAKDAHDAVLEGVEVGRENARGLGMVHGRGMTCMIGRSDELVRC